MVEVRMLRRAKGGGELVVDCRMAAQRSCVAVVEVRARVRRSWRRIHYSEAERQNRRRRQMIKASWEKTLVGFVFLDGDVGVARVLS